MTHSSPSSLDAEPLARRASSRVVLIRGAAGAIAGGLVGLVAFQWLARHGFYAIMLPGALLGLGAGLAARGKSVPLGVLCGTSALALAILAEWFVFPFAKNTSLSFFLAHVQELPPPKLMMMGLGGLFALWFGTGR